MNSLKGLWTEVQKVQKDKMGRKRNNYYLYSISVQLRRLTILMTRTIKLRFEISLFVPVRPRTT